VAAADGHRLRVGLAAASDLRDAAAFSGVPASLYRALGEVVADPVMLSGAVPPGALHVASLLGAAATLGPRDLGDPRAAMGRAFPPTWLLGRPAIWARSALIRARMRRTPVDGCILHGTQVTFAAATRFVTYQDSTLVQAHASYPWPYLGGIGDRQLAAYVRRQRAIYRRAQACCATTHWVADSIVGDYGVPRERVHVVGLGANHDIRPPERRDWGVPRFLFVGQDWTRKNGALVVEAFADVRRAHPVAELHLVGGHPPVCADGVHGHGTMPLGDTAGDERLARLWQHATCFVMPSLHEPAGQVFAEAAASGLPSIGSTNGGSITVIGDGGVVVDPHDRAALTAAMLHLCDPPTAQRLGERAIVQAQRFTWRKVAERLVRALDPAAADRRGLAGFL
jgi:glycosyltransferase involved in cell wall biosynthesis